MSRENPHFGHRPNLEKTISCQSDQVRFFSHQIAEPFTRSEVHTFVRPGFDVGTHDHHENANYPSCEFRVSMMIAARASFEEQRKVEGKKHRPKNKHTQTPPTK